MSEHAFSRIERLRKNKEFLLTRREGKKYKTDSFIIYLRPNELGFTRLGLSVSSKVGNAVKRNRIKRLLREFFRLNKKTFPVSADIIISVRSRIQLKGYDEVEKELRSFLKNL